MTTEVSTSPSFDVAQLPNIVMGSGTQQPHPRLKAVLWELASKNPTWQFKGQSKNNDSHDKCFQVLKDSELLGSIRVAQGPRRTGYQHEIAVTCRKIEQQLTRKKAYQTNDDSRAIAKVRKFFAPKTASEIIAEAYSLAAHVAINVESEKQHEIRAAKHHIQQKALAFFQSKEGMELFAQYLRRINDLNTMEKISAANVMQQEMLTISAVRAKIGKDKAALVVVDEGNYLVKVLESLNMYDDTTLPENLRGKLGLLKLVAPKQFVSSAGFRVSEEVFLIDLEAK